MWAVGIGLGAVMALIQLRLTGRLMTMAVSPGRMLMMVAVKLGLWAAVMLPLACWSIQAVIALVATATVIYIGYLAIRHARSR